MRIKVLADASFRARNSNWSQEARGLIEAPVRDESATDDLTAEGGSLDGGPSDDVAPDDGEDETSGSQES